MKTKLRDIPFFILILITCFIYVFLFLVTPFFVLSRNGYICDSESREANVQEESMIQDEYGGD